MSTPIQNHIQTVFIPVSDIEKARGWYCGILGVPADGEILHGHLYILPMRGTAGIVLDSRIYAPEKVFRFPAVQLRTDDIEGSYAYLKARNVELASGIEYDQWFNFKDPDGNMLMICKC
ncbi:VOC family protein [Paenibacillus sp. HJL G12]|uniref:VOC family protein n=1 Tax=Paenibacillus dendrobii TaxID=2691084 RepID=A0A7X3IHY8_9BACL|nr:VOC family protein [Paenibacillus dendrobii]MWV44279.1 VOC family protein [Paenibacillus dendrobii]